MSVYETDKYVSKILQKYCGDGCGDVKKLVGGHHSSAYSFEYRNQLLILRINPDRLGFDKDATAYNILDGYNIPTPEILSNGMYIDGVYFSISEKITGETIRDKYNRNDYSSFEKQFRCIDEIANVQLSSEQSGYGEWGSKPQGSHVALKDYIQRLYPSERLINWEAARKIPFFKEEFIQHLSVQLDKYIKFSKDERDLVHGDFGNDNVFMSNDEIVGVIDWEKSYYGDRLYDVARVVLYCPNRNASTATAIDHYRELQEPNYKERIIAGVYYIMINNYVSAAFAGRQKSCESSQKRIEEIEKVLNI